MKTLIVYDSVFGNTEKMAQTIGNVFNPDNEVKVVKVSDAKLDDLIELDLLIVGSPTRKFRPIPAITRFLKKIPANGLQGIKVAAFDTRISESEIKKIRILAVLVNIFGYAAKPILNILVKKGGDLIALPEGFYVGGTEGPLLENEFTRAADWVKKFILK